MRVAIYSEGRSDQAVITNILKGILNIDRSDIKNDLPEYELDQTDLHTFEVKNYSTWTLVKEECEKKERISKFLDTFEQERFIIVQIDSAERNQMGYEVLEPVKGTLDDNAYSITLRENIITKITEWLAGAYQNSIAHAVTIEELEAWLLTFYERSYRYDTCRVNDPKTRLSNILNRVLSKSEKNNLKAPVYDRFFFLSHPFRKRKVLADCCLRNKSLDLFCTALNTFNIDES